MQELETLLNSLVQRDWKPWNEKADFCEYKFWKFRFLKKSGQIVCMYSLRELVSLESGLWQFVCINDLYKYSSDELVLNPSWRPDWLSSDWSFFCGDSAYRLLESALIPEEGLGKFLVDNIIVKWNSKYEIK